MVMGYNKYLTCDEIKLKWKVMSETTRTTRKNHKSHIYTNPAHRYMHTLHIDSTWLPCS